MPQQSELCVFRVHGSGCAPFLTEETAVMDTNVFKDHLWDLINESDALDVIDIRCDDQANLFEVIVRDGSSFLVRITRSTELPSHT